jgi:hypothetical protein
MVASVFEHDRVGKAGEVNVLWKAIRSGRVMAAVQVDRQARNPKRGRRILRKVVDVTNQSL